MKIRQKDAKEGTHLIVAGFPLFRLVIFAYFPNRLYITCAISALVVVLSGAS